MITDEQNGAVDPHEYVSVVVAGQLFGLPIERVRQVFRLGEVTPVPLAPVSVAGLVNLRGRVAIAIDLRERLGLPRTATRGMAAGLEFGGDIYALLVDEIGDVLRPSADHFDPENGHLPSVWRDFARGVYRLPDRLMVPLDIDAILDLARASCPSFSAQTSSLQAVATQPFSNQAAAA